MQVIQLPDRTRPQRKTGNDRNETLSRNLSRTCFQVSQSNGRLGGCRIIIIIKTKPPDDSEVQKKKQERNEWKKSSFQIETFLLDNCTKMASKFTVTTTKLVSGKGASSYEHEVTNQKQNLASTFVHCFTKLSFSFFFSICYAKVGVQQAI